ncbi:MAG: cheB 1 [Thermoleophilia bacterium]|nr:cheB 1 [Thermoleophilia bacterium]
MSDETGHPIVCIGASWGGVDALRTVLKGLPADLPTAICIVLHRPDPDGIAQLARVLSKDTGLTVCEPDDKQEMSNGVAYVAPAGYHLMVEDGHLALSVEDRVRWARPSVDVLFETAAESRAGGAIAVVLTGANDDGARGARAVHAAGGTVLVQDPDEAERREMPDAAIAMTEVDAVLPLDDIAGEIVRRIRGLVPRGA